MATTVHCLSDGRLQLGLGAGWYKAEYLAFGYEFPNFKIRKEQLIEGLKLIRKLLMNGEVEFNGKYYRIRLELYPRLEQKLHLIVGGRSPSIIKAASQYAD